MAMIGRTDILRHANAVGLSLEDDDVSELATILEVMGGLVERLDHLAPEIACQGENARAVRDPGRRASQAEDPLNAVIRWCDVKSDEPSNGALEGLRVGIKDCVAIAGVPMTAGTRILDGYVPEMDATVVRRLIEADARIIATLNMEGLAWSGGGETSYFGAVRNPFDSMRTASGSSGGSAAALFYDSIDVTIGGDQGGSIRLPASWCGVLGLKPTFGLVPYSGALSIEYSCDYLGPMTRTVGDMASVMDVIAGPDSWDARQWRTSPGPYHFRDTVDSAPGDLSDVTIGVLKEGFAVDESEPIRDGTLETLDATRAAIERFERLGANIVEVSVPEHEAGGLMLFPVLVEAQNALLSSNGNAYHVHGRYSPDLSLAFARGIRSAADDLPATIKFVAVLGEYLRQHRYGVHYGSAKNFFPKLRQAYDQVLTDIDFLVMPTTAHFAHEISADASASETVLRGITMVKNTGQFNMTGHPAISLPAAEAEGLPVGVMMVGRHFDDARLLQVARSYEREYGWLPE